MILYQINLPKTKSAEDFVRFMQDEFIPSINKGATRIGKVMGLALLQSQSNEREFLWQVDWSGLSDRDPRIDDEKLKSTFAPFKPKFKRLGDFTGVADWKE